MELKRLVEAGQDFEFAEQSTARGALTLAIIRLSFASRGAGPSPKG